MPSLLTAPKLLPILLLLVVAQSKTSWKSGNHDSRCYTQGLSFINQTHVLQSCGQYGRSYFQIHTYNAAANTLTPAYKSNIFAAQYFLEGSIYYPQNQIYYILTWQEHKVFRFRYNRASSRFQELSQLRWESQGWGMTHNNSHIFISDGSNHIYVTDAELNVKQTLAITKRGLALAYLNQLQWAEQDGEQYIYANVYLQNLVVKVSIAQQKVVQSWDLSTLERSELSRGTLQSGDVLNGIAIQGNTMIVTGKYWKTFFTSQYRT